MDLNIQAKDAKTPKVQYLNKRLKELDITANYNLLITKNNNKTHKFDYFEADEYGNIIINYFNIHGNRAQFRKKGNKWEERFVRTRVKDPKPNPITGKINKYLSPKGSGLHPFFPPQIIEKVKRKKPIETLFITEGEFKAFKGAMHGIDIIGIPSIHGFYDNEKHDNKKIKILHFEIEQLVEICKVKNIVYLTDADTLTVNWEADKDLQKRPLSFYSAVRNIRQALNPLLITGKINKIYYAHIHASYNYTAKGLDDLLKNKNTQTEIVKDIYKLDKSKSYFSTIDITSQDYNRQLVNYFGIKNVNDFYKVYGDFIDNKEFKYDNAIYYHDNEKIVFVYHNDVEKYLRVGGNWYNIIYQPNAFKELERNIIPYPKTEIIQDYGKFKGFLNGVKKYEAFTVYPDWINEHIQDIHNSFNLYSPMAYQPKKGNWENTYKFLKHVFQGAATIDLKNGKENNIKGDQFSVFLDYLTIQYTHPMHMLPVPILVSKAQGTGKTTLLKWLAEVYKGNSVVLNNAQFQSKFNGHYISKYIIGVDEAIMGADNVEAKKDKERLKQLVTDNTAQLEDKGVNLKKIPFYGKILMTSNDEDTLMKIDDEDTRFFIIKVPQIPKELKDPDLFIKMKKEIPALLYYLKTRAIFHKRVDRFWFATEDILTEHFYSLKEATKSPLEKAIENTIKEMFYRFELDTINMHPEYLLDKINKTRSRKFQITQLKDKLKTVYKLPMYKQNRFKIPVNWVQNHMTKDEIIDYSEHRRRYNIYYKTDWLTELERIPVIDPESLNEIKSNDGDLPY